MNDPLIEARDIKKYFPVGGGLSFTRRKGEVRAVDGVSFRIYRSKTFGLVGESGCGKTTTANLVLRLERPTFGQIDFLRKNIGDFHGREIKKYRRSLQAVFQDPFASLNPRMRIGSIISEPLAVQNKQSRQKTKNRIDELLEIVGLRPDYARRYPHEFSGGQRQRIAIARAISTTPELIVLDEPVSALDVSIRAQILNLLLDLQQEFGLAYMLIAHDLAVVEYACDTIAVMYLGKITEMCSGKEFFKNPLHPYTHTLLEAVPIPDPSIERKRIELEGEPPSPWNLPTGCRFHPRCSYAEEVCREIEPLLEEEIQGHMVACHMVTKKG